MAKRPAYTALSARVWVGQMDLIKRAATALSMTVPEYTRFRLVPQAAKDARVPLPEFPTFGSPGRPRGKAVEQAAEALGLTVGEFRRQMVERAAELIVGGLEGPAPDTGLGETLRASVRHVSDVVPRVTGEGVARTRSTG